MRYNRYFITIHFIKNNDQIINLLIYIQFINLFILITNLNIIFQIFDSIFLILVK